MSPPQAKRQQRKLNFLITQTELYAHFMSGKANIGGVEGDPAQEEILRKLEDNSAQRQIDIGGGVMVNAGQEDYGTTQLMSYAQNFSFLLILSGPDLLLRLIYKCARCV